jgi:FAD binding domain
MPAAASAPLSAHELCEAMRHALPYDPARLDRVLRHDANNGLIEVQANTLWKSVASALRPGDAQAANARTTFPTVGESIARNAAGPDGRPAVTHVDSLTLVTPAGELRRVNRVTHGELFGLIVGGQGLFGALYSTTLRIESLVRAISESSPVETLALDETSEATRPLHLLVPPDKLASFIEEARARCAEWRTAISSAEVRRTLPEDETVLRWSRREYASLTLQLAERQTIGGSVRSTQLRRELIDAAIARGGGFPIACTPEATREQTEACYPQLKTVLAEKRRIDPEEKLVNAWYLHYRNLLARKSCEGRWKPATLSASIYDLDVLRGEPGAELGEQPIVGLDAPGLAERDLARGRVVHVFDDDLAGAAAAGAIGREDLLQALRVSLAVHGDAQARSIAPA